MQFETEKETKDCSNLEKLRSLVTQLEQQNQVEPPYTRTLTQIEKVIKEEKKIIGNLKKDESKIKHYEMICSSIMSLISAAS